MTMLHFLKKKKSYWNLLFEIPIAFILTLVTTVFVMYLLNKYDLANTKDTNISSSYYFVKLILIAPFFEDLSFRLFLIRNKKYLIISIIGILYAFLAHVSLDVAFITGFFVLNVLLLFEKILDYIFYKVYNVKKIYLVLISSLLFSIPHIGNYEIHTYSPFLIILIIPYFFAGILLSYFRIKYSIMTSISIHMLNNVIAYSFYLLMK